jgi:tripartite-type tricarboxylate transporter receptor subunit TctC
MAKFNLLLLVNPESKFKSLPDLIAYAKQHPKELNFGSVSVGSTQYLAAELFKQFSSIDAQVVPYKLSSNLFTALRSGDIDVAFEYLPPAFTLIKSGTVKALIVAAEKRIPALPEVPTAKESGMNDYEVTSWNAVSARAGTPRAILEKLNTEFVAAINDPEVGQLLRKMNSEPFPLSLDKTKELMSSEILRWKSLIDKSNINLN